MSSKLLRENNIIAVLKEISRYQPISRSDISKKISVNKASISEIVNLLLDLKLVKEVGIGEGSTQGGRKPVMLILNDEAAVFIGIDVKYDTIEFKETDFNNTPLRFHILETTDYYHSLKQYFDGLLDRYQDLPFRVAAVTISIHGIIHNNRIVYTPNYDVSEIETLIHSYPFPIFLINEADVSANIHHYLGNDDDTSVSVVSIGSGIGSGMVTKQGIFEGQMGTAGELGHTIVVPNGKQCPCGNKGCLEQYASDITVLANYREVKGDFSLTLSDFLDDYQDGDREAEKIMESFIFYLSIGINNYIALYASEKIYLGGKIFSTLPYLIDSLIENLNSRYTKKTSIELAKFNSVDGASMYSILQFIELEKFHM